MYPRLKIGVDMGTVTWDDSSEEGLYVSNKKGKLFDISQDVYDELYNADGTHPLNLPEDLQDQMKRDGIITTSRFDRDRFLIHCVLFIVGKRARRWRSFCRILNFVLPTLAVTIFAFSVFLKLYMDMETSPRLDLPVCLVLVFISVLAHEFGHLVAAIAYGYKVTEVGLMLFGIFPIAAYVSCDRTKGTTWKRMQLSMAGIEVNLILAGLFLLFSMAYYPISFTFVIVANVNVSLALINILPGPALDGEMALSSIFGVKSICDIATKVLPDKKERQQVLSAGLYGKVFLLILLFTYICKLLLSILTVMDLYWSVQIVQMLFN